MIKVSFLKINEVSDTDLKFAVIMSRYCNKWILCRHKRRTTWEIPGGHREYGEMIEETAKRELTEETGAIDFNIDPLTAYCVEKDNKRTYGILFFAEVTKLEPLSGLSEIGEIGLFDLLPDELTYPEIQPVLYKYISENTSMCHSYVMGINNNITLLKINGFDVNADAENYTVTFPKYKAPMWEDFISEYLLFEYWNEYLIDDKVVFLFHLRDGIKRIEVENYSNDEVLQLCKQLCNCKFESIKSMLLGNRFYKRFLEFK